MRIDERDEHQISWVIGQEVDLKEKSNILCFFLLKESANSPSDDTCRKKYIQSQ